MGESPHPVQHLLDGQHVAVPAGGLDEIHQGVEIVIGMMKEQIPAAELLKDVLMLQMGHPGLEGVLFLPQVTAQGEEGGQVQKQALLEYMGLRNLEGLHQVPPQLRMDCVLQLQPDHLPPFAPLQRSLDLQQEVVGLLVPQLQVPVAGDPVHRGRQHLPSLKELPDVVADDLLRQHVAASGAVFQGHEPGQHRGHLDGGEIVIPRLRVLTPDQYGDVQALVQNQGKGRA